MKKNPLLAVAVAAIFTIASGQGIAAAAFMSSANVGDLTPQQSAALTAIRNSPATVDVQIVKLNSSKLADKAQVSLPLRFAAPLSVQGTSRLDTGPGQFTWEGKTLDLASGDATFVVHGDAVTGMIQTANGLIRVSPLGGGLHAVVHVDPSKLPRDEPPQPKKEQPPSSVPATTAPNTGDRSDAAPVTTIRVLVGYTPAVASREGSAEAVTGLADLAVSLANKSYENSGVSINLVSSTSAPVPVNFSEGSGYDSYIDALEHSQDPAFVQLRATRANSHAALVVLLVNDSAYCGEAADIPATRDTAYAAVAYSCAADNYSLAHELGHLQGARHNIEEDNSATQFNGETFPWVHGYMDCTKKVRTIMAYDDCQQGSSRMPQWSRPPDWGNGATADDARILEETAAYIASFSN